MFRKMKAGSTSQSIPIFVQDSSSTTGAGLGSLVYNTASLAAKYRRQGESSWTTITLATMTLGTWASGGFVSDGGPVTGTYELGIPNAVLAAGAEWAEVAVYGATNMLAVLIFFELDAVNYQSATAFITGVNSLVPPSNWNTLSIGVGGTVTVSSINDDSITATSFTSEAYDAIADHVRTELAVELARIDVATSTRLASASYTAPLDAAGVRTAVGLASANLDTQLAAIAGYVDTEVGAIYSRLGAPAGASIAADIAAVAGYVDTEVAAIKAKTDSLTFTVSGKLDANVKYVNDVQVTGTGASGDEWGPA